MKKVIMLLLVLAAFNVNAQFLIDVDTVAYDTVNNQPALIQVITMMPNNVYYPTITEKDTGIVVPCVIRLMIPNTNYTFGEKRANLMLQKKDFPLLWKELMDGELWNFIRSESYKIAEGISIDWKMPNE